MLYNYNYCISISDSLQFSLLFRMILCNSIAIIFYLHGDWYWKDIILNIWTGAKILLRLVRDSCDSELSR